MTAQGDPRAARRGVPGRADGPAEPVGPSHPELHGRVDRGAGGRPAWRLVVAGTIAAALAMICEARLGPRDPEVVDPSSWWGILPSGQPTDTARGVLAATAGLAVIGLCLSWLLLLARARRGTISPRAAGAAALAWAVPFAVGPPLFSRDVYAYAAQGELAHHGLDPATHGVNSLLSRDSGADLFVAAVDPRWRDTHAPYGGLGVGAERACAALADLLGTGAAGTVAALRVVALISTVALVALALRLPGRSDQDDRSGQADQDGRRGRAAAITLALLAANPFVIIHLVGGAHLDALAAALLTAALVTDRARTSDRGAGWALGAAAVALACLAGSVKATAFLGAGWLVFVHVRDAWHREPALGTGRPGSDERPGAGGRAAAVGRALAADTAAAAGALLVGMAAGGFGPTWIGALATSGKLETGIAPASILASLVGLAPRIFGLEWPGGSDAVLGATRTVVLAGVGLTVAWLALRTWPGRSADRPESGRRDDLIVVGFGGMAVALGSPVVYPWYLALSVPFLAVLVALAPPPVGRQTRAAVGLIAVTSVWLCLATLSPLAATWRLLGRTYPLLGVALAVVLVAALSAATVAAVRRRAIPGPRPGARTTPR
ncbi:polyprenol phosphomannose-dependent alpha 1,6 mannosyltransferase MptB [Parafrankia discariae]|uniref:polyprenol phosphomannose-dependent alpha 1,6 mannosyltransferase MptB n=1 Tax=Parafrankia discariae TaxID=365528 RepID=UPI000376DD0C|nr:polyprenol phosphomannose-dependent alpha 1,6 mannosyltransferase MptB [Parafrankia discariae]